MYISIIKRTTELLRDHWCVQQPRFHHPAKGGASAFALFCRDGPHRLQDGYRQSDGKSIHRLTGVSRSRCRFRRFCSLGFGGEVAGIKLLGELFEISSHHVPLCLKFFFSP